MAQVAIWWVRRDLRLEDNQALTAALAHAPTVLPVFILDPAILGHRYHRQAERRKAFLFGGLRAVDGALRERGSRLIVRQGEPEAVLAELARATGAGAVFAEQDPAPYPRRRDLRVAERLMLRLLPGVGVHPPDRVRKTDGAPYTVFTPFSRAWRAQGVPSRRELLAAPTRLSAPPPRLRSEPIPEGEEPGFFPPGEAEAQRRLRVFTAGEEAPISAYADGRDRMDLDGTSGLSPYLRFGMLSARAAGVAAVEAATAAPDPGAHQGAETWLGELAWRDFYQAVLYHFPHVLETAFNPALRAIPWREAPEEFAAWQAGRTGYPVVDACMRQLAATGWMHNRGRMIVASFLTKELLLDWRLGEQHFMDLLVDGDPASNNGGWQWTAGVGTDAAPYFRIFSPVLQSRKCDPQGVFIRRFVPELARVPGKFIHEPWRMSAADQRAAGCAIGTDYPAPLVDRALSRPRTLEAYRRSKSAGRG
jgi:deoxyribodipyrimidine photo-lyase